MNSNLNIHSLVSGAKRPAFWVLSTTLLSSIVGTLVALFLWLLEVATHIRWQNPWLLWLLPLAGIGIYYLYQAAGKNAAGGNNLILEEIHQPGPGVPARMAPLVLGTTIITHLLGGSAGREGTAVQIGGSVADQITRWLKIGAPDRRTLLMMGIAAGFGAVFGTPVAGAVFAIEVVAIGQLQYRALLPCLAASFLAHGVCTAWGIEHNSYHIQDVVCVHNCLAGVNWVLFVKAAIAGVAFGGCSRLFVAVSHGIKGKLNAAIPHKQWLIPVMGGLSIIALSFIPGNTSYLGLGVTSATPDGISIISAFRPGGADTFSWLWKLLFTAITLSTGFKGGEVTPLFFMGATLGNVLSGYLGAPADLFAGLGFVAVFAGATNTPLACIVMGAELFGLSCLPYMVVACVAAYYSSGHQGIYSTQRVHRHKWRRTRKIKS